MGKKSGSGSGTRIRDEHSRSYFQELRPFLGVKIFKFFDANPGSGMEKIPIGIRDKHPGSAKLHSAYCTGVLEKKKIGCGYLTRRLGTS
jgi:hypothetical protein